MGDFVTPEAHRITLSGGQTIDIAKVLSHGDSEDMFSRMLTNRNQVRTAKILAYLIGWSLMRDDKPVPYSPMLTEQERIDTIRGLNSTLAIEIHTAIEDHEKKMAADRKKGQGGKPESAAISPLPDSADGPSETSAPLA